MPCFLSSRFKAKRLESPSSRQVLSIEPWFLSSTCRIRARSSPASAADAEAVLTLLGAVLARRTPAGWRAVDESARTDHRSQDAVAARLGITQQAVSERLRTALWTEEVAVRPAAARLLTAAAG